MKEPTLLSISELVDIIHEREMMLETKLPNLTVETVTEWCNKELVQEVWTTHENPLQGDLLTLRGCMLVAMTLPQDMAADVSQTLLVRFNGWAWVMRKDNLVSENKNAGVFSGFFDKGLSATMDKVLSELGKHNHETNDWLNSSADYSNVDPLAWYEENKDEIEALHGTISGFEVIKGPGNKVTIINKRVED